MTEFHLKIPPFPKALQRVEDTLTGTFTEHRRCDIAFLAQMASTFQEGKVINPAFLYDLAFYSRQSIRQLKEDIHVPSSILIEFSVNGKRAAVHTVLATFRKESTPLLRREPGYAFLKSFEPI